MYLRIITTSYDLSYRAMIGSCSLLEASADVASGEGGLGQSHSCLINQTTDRTDVTVTNSSVHQMRWPGATIYHPATWASFINHYETRLFERTAGHGSPFQQTHPMEL